jgi:hypothetical protein
VDEVTLLKAVAVELIRQVDMTEYENADVVVDILPNKFSALQHHTFRDDIYL